MRFKKYAACFFVTFLVVVPTMEVGTGRLTARAQAKSQQPSSSDFITAQELKAKVEKNQRVTIIDVRSSSAAIESGIKIKGAIYVKLRKLKYRLSFPPLKDLSHDSEVVTYCACPSDEASLRAAQLLQEAGFKRVRALKGGWNGWLKAKGPIEQVPRG